MFILSTVWSTILYVWSWITFTVSWTYFFISIGVVFSVITCLLGDTVITLAVQNFGKDYLDPKFKLKWSALKGMIKVEGLDLTQKTLDIIDGFVPLPAGIKAFKVDSFFFQVPIVQLLMGKSFIFYGMQVEGFVLDLAMHAKEKWIWRKEENAERLQKDIEGAKTARLTQANTWTQALKQKFADLEKPEEPPSAVKKPVESKTTKEETAVVPKWKIIVDRFISKFEIAVSKSKIGVYWEHDKSLGIVLNKFHMLPSTDAIDLIETREIQIQDFNIYLDAGRANKGRIEQQSSQQQIEKKDAYLVCPLSINMALEMPLVMQGVLVDLKKRKVANVKLNLEDVTLQVRPAQVSSLMSILPPLNEHAAWFEKARTEDEKRCKSLSDEEKASYKDLYAAQVLFEKSSFFKKFIDSKRDSAIGTRVSKLSEMEATTLAKDILKMRIEAIEHWVIPSAGEAVPHVSQTVKYEADLDQFLQNPVSYYQEEEKKQQSEAKKKSNVQEKCQQQSLEEEEQAVVVDVPPLHEAKINLVMSKFALEPLDDDDNVLFSFFVHDMALKAGAMLTADIADDEKSVTADISVARFGIFDPRKSDKNLFSTILDRNPEANGVMKLTAGVFGSGHIDVDFAMLDFSFLIILDPFVAAMRAFGTVADVDEDDIDYDYEVLQKEEAVVAAAEAAAKDNTSTIIYKKDLPPPYSALLLGGMSLSANIVLKGWEVCLLGDPSTLKSHSLALTSDTELRIKSGTGFETIELELEEVALQPCNVQVLDGAIGLDIVGARTILELEGDGVDLRLAYRVDLAETTEAEVETPIAGATATTEITTEDETKEKLVEGSSSKWITVQEALGRRELYQDSDDGHERMPSSRNVLYRGNSIMDNDIDAYRTITMEVSDLALNFSKDDVGVLLGISTRAGESFAENPSSVKEREEKEARIASRQKEAEFRRHSEKLKQSFKSLDVDGGGTLDASEVEALLRKAMSDNVLTEKEFDQSVASFLKLVDGDGSGDICFEEFAACLDPNARHYELDHQGTVTLTAQEFKHPRYKRSAVPTTNVSTAMDALNAANVMALSTFWDTYTEQTGATRTSLSGQSPLIVQKKMIRVFNNYEYAQEAWNRLVYPALTVPVERSKWLITRTMAIEGRGNIAEELMSSMSSKAPPLPAAPKGAPSFIQTTVTTKFGGMYFRIIDILLPVGTPSIEVACEEVSVNVLVSLWEGVDSAADAASSSSGSGTNGSSNIPEGDIRENCGSSEFSFSVYGRYYNSRVRQLEPFLEPYQGTLRGTKIPGSALSLVYSSDKYLHMNVTAALMDTLQADMTAFSSVLVTGERSREHITEHEGGIFWLKNDCGEEVSYWIETTRKDQSHSSPKSVVKHDEFDACVAGASGENDEAEKADAAQLLKEKQMRAAFRNADQDGSGELEADEVRFVLQNVMNTSEEELSEEEMNEQVEEFMKLADTDGSGQVSWDEFKEALSKSRVNSNRTLSLKLPGYEPLSNIPIDLLGSTLVYELEPEIYPPLRGDEDIAELYDIGRSMYMKQNPSQVDYAQARAVFKKVAAEDAHYEWVDSYLPEVEKHYCPILLSVALGMEADIGMKVTVKSALSIKNGTGNVTEIQLLDENKACSPLNPKQGEESFFSVPPSSSIPVPIGLINTGSFVIRQVGEEDWSDDSLPLTVSKQQQMVAEQNVAARENTELLPQDPKSDESLSGLVEGKEHVWDTIRDEDDGNKNDDGESVTIDGHPTCVIETGTVTAFSEWNITMNPQFIFQNSLPCVMEYVFVQPCDDPLYEYPSGKATKKKHRLPDYSQEKVAAWEVNVSKINNRCGTIASGESVQISGLCLKTVAYIKVRGGVTEEECHSAKWSNFFPVHLNSEKHFKNVTFTVPLPTSEEGPVLSFDQEWESGSARKLVAYAPFWIQNKSGLELRYNLNKGSIPTLEGHKAYFGADHGYDMPFLVQNLDAPNAKLCVKPFRITDDSDPWNRELSSSVVRKYLPDFKKAGWSDNLFINNVGVNVEIRDSSYGFVISAEVSVAPNQFNRTKIVTFYPRYVVANRLDRALHLTPVHLGKLGEYKLTKVEDRIVSQLEPTEALIIYKFEGSVKHDIGFRTRDPMMMEDYDGMKMGDWLPVTPLSVAKSYDMWSRGPLKAGPLIRFQVGQVSNSTFVNITDASKSSAFRIENRSTTHCMRYTQVGVARAVETVIEPMTWHSFAWQNPLLPDPRLKLFVGNSRHPLIIDVTTVFEHGKVSPDGGKSNMYGEVYIDGASRVLAFGDSSKYNVERSRSASSYDMMEDISVDVGLHGFGMTIIDTIPQEIMNVTAERISLSSAHGSREISFTVHHVQIDDMTHNSMYPVLFAPLDSGFNSNKAEWWGTTNDGDKKSSDEELISTASQEVPFFKFAIETAPGDGITVFNKFGIDLGSMENNISVDYLLLIADVMLRFLPPEDPATAVQNGITSKDTFMNQKLVVPESTGSGALLYFKQWYLTAFNFSLVFDSNPDKAGGGISSILGDTFGSIFGGIAHVTPEFRFKEIEFDNAFFYADELAYEVVMKIVYNVLGQFYKILGSLELLGDPVGLASEFSDKLALAVRQTKRDLAGTSDKKGRGAKTLLQAVVGAPANAAGKSINAMGDILKKATYFEDQEDSRQPKHVGSGLLQGGAVFGKSLAYGVSGIVSKPIQGAKEDGVKGFTKGVGKGAVRLVASPFVGVLGAAEKLSQSVYHTTHLGDPVYYEGTRRPARELQSEALKTLPESNIMTEMEVHILKATGLPENQNPKFYVHLYDKPDGVVMETFKSTTLRHADVPEWNESRMFDVSSTNMVLDIEVYHKRPPLAKKLLGKTALSIQDIYERFDLIPEGAISNVSSRAAVKAKKRYKGSALDSTTSLINESYDVEMHEDGEEEHVASPALVMPSPSPNSPSDTVITASSKTSTRVLHLTLKPAVVRVLPLEGGEAKNAKIHLSIRFVNSMRR